MPGDLKERLRDDRTALVTGAGGFAGRHLVEHLLGATSWRVAGMSRSGFGDRTGMPGDPTRFLDLRGDITDSADVGQVIEQAKPDYVFHLAARTPPAEASEQLATAVQGTVHLLEHLMKTSPGVAVLAVGSDAQYGPQDPASLPTRESASMHPVNSYGRSKLLQERVALTYQRAHGMRVVCVRPFNHLGPGQSARFVVASLAGQIAGAEVGRPSIVELGSELERRDFTDVRDTVRAYLDVLLLGRSGGVYNIGSGVSHGIGEVARMLAGLATVEIEFRSVEGRIRHGDPSVTRCDYSRLQAATGWGPAIDFKQSLNDTLEYWRKVVRLDMHEQRVGGT